MPYLTESIRLVDEGCDYRTVDRLLQDFGLPMGPFALLDEIGIDIAIEVAAILGSSYGGRMEPPALFAALKGRKDLLGKKSGRGFYVYSGKNKTPNPEMLRLAAKPIRQRDGPDEGRKGPARRTAEAQGSGRCSAQGFMRTEASGPITVVHSRTRQLFTRPFST